jgi:hypothetical protein
MKAINKIKLLVVTTILLITVETYGQWATDAAVNNAVSTATANQFNQAVIPDGADGAIMVWQDTRSGNTNIYAQRINGLGIPQWTANGVAICTAADEQTNPKIITDENGGAIITWQDRRGGSNFDIYAQRINASGVVQWTANGVVISTATNGQENPNLESDSNGGAVIVWTDNRGANADIYGQRINGSGVVQWAANGVAICSVAGNQSEPVIKNLGVSLPFVVAWNDTRNAGSGFDIYYQIVNINGNLFEVAAGVPVCTANQNQFITDVQKLPSSLGVIITWTDERDFSEDVYAQRIDNGVEWVANGVVVCNASNTQAKSRIAVSGNDIYITWEDWRNSNPDIFAQKLNTSGVAQWAANGVGVNVNSGAQLNPAIALGQSGGVTITWQDDGVSGIYAQQLNGSGALQWSAGGVAIGTAPAAQVNPGLISESTSFGNIIVWTDNRNGNQDIYAQRVNAEGLLCGNVPNPGAISGNQNILAASSNTYTVASVLGATSYTWTLPSGWTGSSTTNSITATSSGSGGTIFVRPSNACGLSPNSASLAITVNKQNQTITFPTLTAKTFGDANFNLAATASSTLPVSYVSSNTNVATIVGSTVTIVGAGTTTITASQAGNEIFNAAPNVPRDLVVNKANQTITFNALPAKALGDAPFTLGATASSGLTVSYVSANTAIATVAGNTVTLVATGSVTIHANQAGNNNYNAATQVSQTFCVNPPKPTITATGVNTESPTLTSNAATGNQWFRNDTPIGGATSTTLAITQAGVYKVQVTAGGCASAFSDPFTFVITAENSSTKNEIEIFPNPVSNRLLVRLSGASEPRTVSIFAADCRRMDYLESTQNEIEINTAHYITGFYIVRITSARTNFSSRFTKE